MQSVVEKTSANYDSLIISAHFAAKHPDIVSGKLSLLPDVEYYIEPRLPEYRRGDNFWDTKGKEVSQWDRALLEYYGDPLESELMSIGNLDPNLLGSSDTSSILESCCDFQEQYLERNGSEKLSHFGLDVDPQPPKAVIPWFVQVSSHDDLELTKSLCKSALEYTNLPVKPCIWVKRSFITSYENRVKIAACLDELPVSESFILIDELDKRDTKNGHYQSAIDLIMQISNVGVDPHFLNGDYFANLLSYFGLRGVGFGANYSDSRSEKLESRPSGGPPPRYYLPDLKEYLDPTDVQKVGEDLQTETCQCSFCSNRMSKWEDIHKFANEQEKLSRHHIACRHDESKEIESKDLETLLNDLESSYETYSESVGNMEIAAGTNHLREWPRSIRAYIENTLNDSLESYKEGYY